MQMNLHFLLLHLNNYSDLGCQDKQLVALFIQSGAIKPLQNNVDDVIKRAPVEPCTVKN